MINKESDIKKTENSNVARLVLRYDGIITHELLEGKYKTDIESLSQELDIFIEWSKDEKKTFLIDSRNFKEFNTEERLFIQKNIGKFSRKYAIILKNGLSLYFFNVLYYFSRPTVPTKFFYKVDNAIDWLNQK